MPTREELLAQASQIRREKLLSQAREVQAKRDKTIAEGEKDRPSMAESAMRGVAQGATLGLADEATAHLGAIYQTAKAGLGFRGDIDYGDAYRTIRDSIRKRDDKAQAANPKTFATGDVGASVATSVIPGLGALNAAKGAGVGTIAAKGALSGAITGFGKSEADITKGGIPEALADTASGAALGGGFGAGIGVLGKAIDPKVLKHLAERRAFKAAIGNQGKVYEEAAAKGTVNSIGRDLLDTKAVRFGSKANAIAQRVSDSKKSIGKGIGNVLSETDEIAKGADGASGKEIAAKIREYADEISAPNNESLVKSLQSQADKYEQMGIVPLEEANRLKKSYKWKFGENNSLNQESTNRIKDIIGDEMETSVGRINQPARAVEVAEQAVGTGTGVSNVGTVARDPVADAVRKAGKDLGADEQKALTSALKDKSLAEVTSANDGSALDNYVELKRKYGNMATAEKGAKKLASRQEKNRTFGLTDYMMGGIGAASLGPAGLGLAIVNKLARERGSSAMAVTLDKASEIIASTPNLFGPLTPSLQNAARNGSLPAVHMVLMKNNPSYRDLILQEAAKTGDQ